MEEKSSYKPLIIVIVLLLAGVIWFIVQNEDEIDAFADGITGNQAVREGTHVQEQIRTIGDDHNRRLEEAMGN